MGWEGTCAAARVEARALLGAVGAGPLFNSTLVVTMADTSSQPSSALSEVHTASLLSDVHVITESAIVWVDTDGETRYLLQSCQAPLNQVAFDFKVDAASEAACFKLRVRLPGDDRPLFLYVHPEQVTSLVLLDPDDMAQDVQQKLGDTPVICLQFNLSCRGSR
ncbi:hypothetical protein VM1G_06542 [Cytospora mali]|uniref:Uncharacterized protein n=1 Tax=Cytospora mali TaxID=578113 RepID=A0A194W2Q6_CYTMA|nr:hypothetical protein VM1G_06542 [Valsa mali]